VEPTGNVGEVGRNGGGRFSGTLGRVLTRGQSNHVCISFHLFILVGLGL
jgi:hypothetical protein